MTEPREPRKSLYETVDMMDEASRITAAQFKARARVLAAHVCTGNLTQEQAERALGLEQGEHLARTGVVTGSGAHRDIPRHGSEETDFETWPSLASVFGEE